MSEFMTSADVAESLHVAPATVKRWADAGLLPCEKTAGHHRRFRREDVERFRELQALGSGAGPDAWVELLTSTPDVHEVHARLLSARSRLGSWHAVATHLIPVLVELGARWEAGRLSVVEEHLASELLARGLARCVEAMPANPRAKRVLLATAEGEEHTLGLALTELVAREAGTNTMWAGEPLPLKELASAVQSGAADVVCLSASAMREPKELSRQARKLAAAARASGTRIVFGGSGEWPEIEAPHIRLQDFRALREWLEAA